MGKNRLEAFSGDVLAIIIAIMVQPVLVALLWLIPDRRIERVLATREG